jgi:hypothetical protein
MKEVYTMKNWMSIDISRISPEDVGSVWKCFVGSEVFYRANSVSNPFQAYVVAWHRDHHAFTCTCPSGLVGFSNCTPDAAGWSLCRHVRAVVAAVLEERQALAELRTIIEREGASVAA